MSDLTDAQINKAAQIFERNSMGGTVTFSAMQSALESVGLTPSNADVHRAAHVNERYSDGGRSNYTSIRLALESVTRPI